MIIHSVCEDSLYIKDGKDYSSAVFSCSEGHPANQLCLTHTQAVLPGVPFKDD